ncbi:tRNA A37 threonylcarbamoyladenosine synthetase subunit TsaC/SUA5/YrdC [Kribbella pratensis]|uniref:tRNA A37 threonylcarbamoyladenosine synthetase subunit TsaC/SUA5/YrdC n=1 Tax=Kribbella pratensis TaxID=2512112 RepID=A0ABY2FIT7_9ACTN|nr:META domain-containing protein [Kribbella pratensis]TDW90985.1 tRNA A37 threonylcarbamoyladenosine synthetase subunit TsaC/SUA5/YrdC [Kribbella pratensis]
MDLPEFDRAQIHAVEVLRGGGAVVVTRPSPMTYGVVARDARAVNVLKGRPVDQPVGISVHLEDAHDQLFRYLDLRSDTLAAADFALAERMSVLAPIRPDPAMPEWLTPAIKDGWVLFFDGAWGELPFLWTSFPFLYGSSANRTGEAPAASAAEARAQFPPGTVIIDADDRRTPAAAYGVSTIIRVEPDGRMSVHRSGVQDQEAGGADVLLDRLREFRSAIGVLDGSIRMPLGKTYLSTAVVEDGEAKQLLPKTRIRLQFARQPNKNEEGPRVLDSVRAYVGCNSLGAAVGAGELLTHGSLSVPGLGGTQVGCQPPLRDQEEWFKTFLTSKPSWQLNGDELTLASGGTTITLLDRKIAEPDFPLDGIRWKVVATITNGDLRQGYGRAEPAWISFDRDRLTGWTGCNELSGSFTRNNTELNFSDVATTDHPCTPESAALQTTILTTLGPAVTYTINHNQLTLLTPSGTGLALKAG